LIEAGDDAGFDKMVDLFGPMLYRYTLRMCNQEPDAEDALQETFLTAKEKIGQFRGEGRLRNWLFKIAGNACRQRHRYNRGRLESELNMEDVLVDMEASEHAHRPWQVDPAETTLNKELSERLEKAIARVPETNRSVLLLRDIEGLSTRETAEALDITEEAVKVRLHRARAFVRNLMRDYFEA
jgi:RNA polymerase sigma-70 factor (ECF subfamily)